MVTKSSVAKAKKLADEVDKSKKKLADQAETSLIPSRLGATATYKISPKSHGYDLVLRFPGVETAVDIIDDCRDGKGDIFRSDIIKEAIDNGVIEAPKELVKQGLPFFADHHGLPEVSAYVATFLMEKLS